MMSVKYCNIITKNCVLEFFGIQQTVTHYVIISHKLTEGENSAAFSIKENKESTIIINYP